MGGSQWTPEAHRAEDRPAPPCGWGPRHPWAGEDPQIPAAVVLLAQHLDCAASAASF